MNIRQFTSYSFLCVLLLIPQISFSQVNVAKQSEDQSEDRSECLKKIDDYYNTHDAVSDRYVTKTLEEFIKKYSKKPATPANQTSVKQNISEKHLLKARSSLVEDMINQIEPISKALTSIWKTYNESLTNKNFPEKDYKKIIESFESLRSSPNFEPALRNMKLFNKITYVCDEMKKYNNTLCGEYLPPGSGKQAVEHLKILAKESSDLMHPVDSVRNVIVRDKFSPIAQNHLIRLERLEDNAEATLIISVIKGKGFTDQVWNEFFPRFKSTIESFWSGTFQLENNTNFTIHIKVEEAKGKDPLAVTIDSLYDEDANEGSAVFDNIQLKNYAIKFDSDFGRKLFAHEVGHVLGFPDMYYDYLDEDLCSIGFHAGTPNDIMTQYPANHVEARQLLLIYKAYVQTPSENLNSFYDFEIESLKSLK